MQKIKTINHYQEFEYCNQNKFEEIVTSYLEEGYKISSTSCKSVLHNFGGWSGGKPLNEKECVHYSAVLIKED